MSRTLQVRNPRTGLTDYQFEALDRDAVAAVVTRLRKGQAHWREIGVEGRAAVMLRWAEAVEARRDALVEALVADTGRYTISRNEVEGVAKKIRRLCATAPSMEGIETPSKMAPDVSFKAQYVPFQLAGMISPWNFPITLSLIDALPALLAGCAVMVKPSELTPRFVEPLRDSIQAVPALAAIFDFVPGVGETGQALVEAVDMVCFTGSVKTGRKVGEAAARRFIPAFLELGGKDPAIVLASADIDRAAGAVLRQAVVNSGQVCLSIERVYVDQTIAARFVEVLVEKASALTINYPDIRSGHLGPIISEAQVAIIEEHLTEAVAGGAVIRCGGEVVHHGGAWLAATVVTNVDHGMRLMTEETFAPIIPVMTFSDEAEAVRLANETDYGLSAAVFAGTDEEALRVAEQIEAGAVSINDAGLQSMTTEAEKMSFKFSGLGGSRMGPAGMMRFFRKKALMIQRGSPRTMDAFAESSAGER